MKHLLLAISFLCSTLQLSAHDSLPLSERLVQTAMRLWPDSFLLDGDKVAKWRYDQGVILTGVERVWYATGKGEYFRYIQQSMDHYVQPDGSIRGYRPAEYNIDHLNNGRQLLLLYEVTGKEKYAKAVKLLRNQLLTHPRTKEGGFWHKEIYPWQMWLDGLYMGQPFYAQYAKLFGEDTVLNDVANQFAFIHRHARDAKSNLLFHGWDESGQQQWAVKPRNTSPHFWGRALGWYGMALVDVLDVFPQKHPKRQQLESQLQELVAAVVKVQDKPSGLWYDIVDLPKRAGNYKEASASAMLTYTIAKALRKGYIDMKYRENAIRAFAGLQKEFIKVEDGNTNFYGTVSVSGLGGKPYRDGSFEYYMSEKQKVNDPKGLGAMIQCAVEMEMMPGLEIGAAKTVLLDRYFNSEKRKNTAGADDYWHYTWDEKSNAGFYAFGQAFERMGAKLANLDSAPTAENLRQASVYIIVDPDHEKDNPRPNYINGDHVFHIKKWVEAGGTLLLMANDSANCDLEHFNKLAGSFNTYFTNASANMVKNDAFETGAVMSGNNKVFKGNLKLYLKEISTLHLRTPNLGRPRVPSPASDLKPPPPLITKDGLNIMAVLHHGKGKVFVVGDPWLYNEYVDGRKLPADFQNHLAMRQLAKWLLQ